MSAIAGMDRGKAQVCRNYIGGGWAASDATRTVPSVSPADTTDLLGQVPLSTAVHGPGSASARSGEWTAWMPGIGTRFEARSRP